MKQSDKSGIKNQIGAHGEEIAKEYLERQGFTIISRNYLKKWGEIDIVARETKQNEPIVHFIEVKSVSYETKADLLQAVSHETYRPEENVHHAKLQRLYRTIEAWLRENSCDNQWQIDICAVRMVPREKYATVKYIRNIVE